MGSLLSLGALAIYVACTPTEISQAEARTLALHATATYVVRGAILDTEAIEHGLGPDDAWTFRVFVRNIPPGTSSNLAGWFSVNKRTAELTNPILDDQPINISQVIAEQKMLIMKHYQQ
jgi:hypothetical protein